MTEGFWTAHVILSSRVGQFELSDTLVIEINQNLLEVPDLNDEYGAKLYALNLLRYNSNNIIEKVCVLIYF